MGISQAGIIFRPPTPITDAGAFVSALLGTEAIAIVPPPRSLDTRLAHNVAVEEFGDVVVVSNSDLAWPLLAAGRLDEPALWAKLGSPAQWMAFCYLDSGGSYGYALYEAERLVRRRLQTTGLRDHPPLAEHGEPLPCERRWLDAPWQLDDEDEDDEPVPYCIHPNTGNVSTQEYLTARMLADLARQTWGLLPWDWTWANRPRMQSFELPARRA